MYAPAILIAILTSLAYGREFTSGEVDKLFKRLEMYGERILNDYKNEPGNQQNDAIQNIQQYLTVTVLSEEEALGSSNWGDQLPDWLANDPNRLEVIFNEKIKKGELPFVPKKPLHGEIRYLYLDKVDKMLWNFQDKQKGKNPYVFVYSFYIPCANVKDIEYSCSQELGEHQLLNKQKYQMVVGWTEIFAGTDEQSSRFFMGMAGIQQFQKTNNVFEKQPLGTLALKNSNIFQTLFHSCLTTVNYNGECCLVNCNGNIQEQKAKSAKILAYYVNVMFATCTLNSNWAGSLTQLRMVILTKCIENYINENTGSSCPKFSAIGTKKILHFCAIFSQAFATDIGTPEDRNDPYSNKWKPGPAAWSALYDGFNADVSTRPEMHCFAPGTSMKSICTLMGKDLSDSLMSKAKNVAKKLKN